MVFNVQDDLLEQISEENGVQGKRVDQKMLEIIKNDKKYVLSLIHFNIRSLNRNIDNLITFLETYELHHIDIIVLTETFQIDSIDNYNIPGYQIFYNEANYNKNDGVVIFVKKHLNVDFSFTKLTNSGTTLSRMNFEINGTTFGLSAVYKPPPVPRMDFINDIYTYLETLTPSNIEIFMGDININILEKNDNHVANYLAMMNSIGFQSCINSVTRSLSKTCLDHLFINQKLKSNNLCFNSYILEVDITDHSPIMFLVRQRKEPQESILKPQENATKFKLNIPKFKLLLKNFDWSIILEKNNSEIATKIFLETYQQLLSSAMETYTIKHKKHKKIKEWISNGIITSIKTRDKMKKKLSKNFSTQLEKEYKEYRNTLNKLIHKQKNQYYKNQIENNKNDMKKLYKIIKDATYENNNNNTFHNIKNMDGQNFSSSLEAANFCNDFYINIGMEMEKTIPPPQVEHHPDPPIINSIYLNPITKNELINHISSLKPNSSPGYDCIQANIIKQTHLEIINPLLHILNLIITTGKIPSEFKTSIITPIHKTGSKTSISNYRPVSLISNFAKLFEKCVKFRLINFLKINSILSTNQFGFIEGFSTVDAMHRLITEIVNNLNSNKKCLAVFLDLAKAFDTVPHNELLKVLERYGIRGVAGQLFGDYLSERIQMVKLNNILSDKQKIKIGIPQGTVLGPVLFIIYIDSLLKLCVDGLTISYADDTALIVSGDHWESVKHQTVNSLRKIKNWLQTYKLTLNLAKTNYIAFSLTSANRPQYSTIVVDDHSIKETSSARYLGIVIDRFLKWQPHIDYVSNKIRKLIHKFYLLREFLNKKTLITIYKTFVESIIRYGILVWGGLYESNLYGLNIIQKYILKIIYKRNRLYPSHLLFNKDIVNIRSIYIFTVCSYIHTRPDLKPFVDHTYETRTRHSRQIKLPASTNNLNLRYINYFGPKLYNLLPTEIRNCTKIKCFKLLSKKVIFENRHQFERYFG